ncbi:MAG: hypothetical protein PF518_19365 [Spirochaetaceae bacterium]|jgi:hypothetical protein|nr:hypothetical protein [Spirochaetaceae bacterium]
MKFTEARLEQAILDLPKEENYPQNLGESISREQSEVLIKEDLLSQEYFPTGAGSNSLMLTTGVTHE